MNSGDTYGGAPLLITINDINVGANPAYADITIGYEAFEDDYYSIHAEVKAYCKSPAEYENSDGGQKYGPIEEWNVSAVTSMASLFYNLSYCNPNISNWDVSAVKYFSDMFA